MVKNIFCRLDILFKFRCRIVVQARYSMKNYKYYKAVLYSKISTGMKCNEVESPRYKLKKVPRRDEIRSRHIDTSIEILTNTVCNDTN